MKLKIGFSTCPNDTFIFDAMIHHKIDTEGLEFEIIMADVEELNKLAFNSTIDVTKLSYHAFAFVVDHYFLLNAGSALGNNNGPLLISKRKIYPDELKSINIAIPGKYTTANLLLQIAFPDAKQKKEYLFSDIEEAILTEEVEAGLIIHENRFTYQKKGLRKILDLGQWWETETNFPIPLGGIAAKRYLSLEVKQKLNRVLRKSVEYALNNPLESYDFVKKYAQELNDDVIEQHIKLYVNNFSVDLGEIGKRAISKLYESVSDLSIIKPITKDIFIQ